MNQQGAHRYEDRLLEFAYGELPASEARSIEAHVKGCARCTGALREIEGVRRQMSQLAPEPVPDAGLDSLLAYAEQAARRTQAGPAPARGLRRWIFGVVSAASLAAVLAVVTVVANRPDLAPASPQSIQKEAARQQVQEAAAAKEASAAPQATPPETAAAGQPLEQDKLADDKDEGGQQGQLVRADAPSREAKVGKAVGKEYVQQVDVSRRLGSKDAPRRQDGNDRLDTMQNMVVGKGTRPVLPTTNAQGYAQKTAPPAADGEMMLPAETKAPHAAAKPSKRAPAPTKKAKMASGGEPGDGFDELFGSAGGGRVSAGAGIGNKKDDSSGSLGMGSAGMARPSSPPAQLESQQRAQAEAARRDEELKTAELKKAERSRQAMKAEEEDAQLELSRRSVGSRTASAPTPAPAAAAAPAGPAPSRSRGAPQVAVNAPPPPVPAAEPEAPADYEPPPAQAQAPMAAPSSSSRKAAATPPPPKVRSESAQELFMSATRARPGSAEEIDGLIRALGAGLAGQYRIDALQRLCTRLGSQGDERALSYCSAWANADPSSEVAYQRAREAESRWGSRAKAKAAKPAADMPAKPAAAEKAVTY